MLGLIVLLVLLTTIIIIAALYQYLTVEKRRTEERMQRYVQEPAKSYDAKAQEAVRQIDAWRSAVRKAGKYIKLPNWSRKIEHQLVQAGIPLKGSEFFVVAAAVSGLAAVLLFMLGRGNIIWAFFGGALGYLAIRIFLVIKIKRRAKAFNDQLGDALVLIANSLRTGFSFMQSMEMVSREMLPPIAVEFARTLREINLGINTEEALNNLTLRIDSNDLDLVVTAVLIQRQVGGNLAEILDNIAYTIRERVRLKGEIRTLTAQGRVSGYIVALLPIIMGIIIYIINPEYMGILLTHPLGRILLAAATVSQMIGMWAVRRIVDIDI